MIFEAEQEALFVKVRCVLFWDGSFSLETSVVWVVNRVSKALCP